MKSIEISALLLIKQLTFISWARKAGYHGRRPYNEYTIGDVLRILTVGLGEEKAGKLIYEKMGKIS